MNTHIQKFEVENRNILGIKLEDKIFNTKGRIQQRFKFNEACSGHIFKGTEKNIEACRIDIDELEE